MRIRSTVAEWQVTEFVEVLKKNKIKKSSDEFLKHLVMFGEARANANIRTAEEHDEFLIAYKEYWRLK